MAENALVHDYNNFNLDNDFPGVAKYICFLIVYVCYVSNTRYRWHRKLLARPSIADAFARRSKLLPK